MLEIPARGALAAGSEMFRTRPPQYAFGRVFSGLAAYPIARR